MNTTVDVSAPPVPWMAITLGVAETNWIEPTVAGATVRLPVALNALPFTVTDAVMVSVPEQPLATYVLLATPPTVVTGEVKVAVPFATHVETKVTSTGVVYALPDESTKVAVTVVLPPADKDELAIDRVPAVKLDPDPLPRDMVGDVLPLVEPVEVVDPPELVLDEELVKAPLPPQPAMTAIMRSMAILLIMLFIFPKASSKRRIGTVIRIAVQYDVLFSHHQNLPP
ncbi:MAG: hypothetical protein P8164_04915 [Gammaproteobacteria bacterium]